MKTGPTSDRKRQKAVDSTHMVPSERGCVPLTEFPLASARSGNGKLAIFSQNKMHLVNTSEEEPLVVNRGTLLAGFGRGKWEQATDETDSSL